MSMKQVISSSQYEFVYFIRFYDISKAENSEEATNKEIKNMLLLKGRNDIGNKQGILHFLDKE